MSGFELTAALVESLAWPFVALVVAWLFRHQLAALLARPLTKVKAGPLELLWDRDVAEVETTLALPEESEDSPGSGPPPDDDLVDLARRAPAMAVIESFARIERTLRQVLAAAGVEPGKGGAVRLARRAHEAGLIEPETARAVEGVAVLRDLAAHGRAGDLDEARALDYIALTAAVGYALAQNAARSSGQVGRTPTA